jgi:glycosyltransferase involved in cell wall biosynthesis
LPTFGAGGAESVMITLANKWVEYNDVYFLVGLAEGEFKHKLNDKIRIIDLNARRFSLSIFNIAGHLRKIKPDFVLSTLIYCNLITTLACLISFVKIKIILREATTPSYDLKGKPKLLTYLLGILYNRANLIIAGSEGVKDDLINNFGINQKIIKVINNPILSEEIIDKSLEELNHTFFNSKSMPVVVTVGKVSEAKDYLTLLKAFKLVNDVIPCKLIIAGNKFEETEEFKLLNHFIESNKLNDLVDFVGFQENPYNYMKRANVFVLSSKYEGSPGVLVQALAINGNVVSTNCKSGPNEILENGKYGRIVPVGDYNLMSLAIIEAIKSPYSFCNAPTLDNFDIETSSNHYFKVINS